MEHIVQPTGVALYVLNPILLSILTYAVGFTFVSAVLKVPKLRRALIVSSLAVLAAVVVDTGSPIAGFTTPSSWPLALVLPGELRRRRRWFWLTFRASNSALMGWKAALFVK
ncbi:hypothetical protein [Rhodopseudomonas sp. RCAM05734]|uniref:hypothetical protein n=1 Tax=Rhodopseudomonas sp. RCAM05734 TaxID=3457549 RepID=UPI004044B0C6